MMQPTTNPLPQRLIKVVGLDPSLRNWGIAAGLYDLDTKQLVIKGVAVVCPDLPEGKQTRVNSLDLESAYQLYKESAATVEGAHAVFAEVPVGSQSARSMASYGICVGVLGALRATGTPFYEVTATEAKVVTGLKKTATKKEMIEWATKKHPEASWPTYMEKGSVMISSAKAEHIADAIATIYAGIAGNQFQQLLSMMTTKL